MLYRQTIERKLDKSGQEVFNYPVLDMCYTSRAMKSTPKQKQEPLLKYTNQIHSYQSKLFNEQLPNYDHFQTITNKDGFIHYYRQMFKDRTAQNQRYYYDNKEIKHFYGPKILIVVCMYNQGLSAINLTLSGIYGNLQALQDEGISHKQVAVVLVQDGILKLVADRRRRTYTKGQASIVEFIKKLDQKQGKQYCELQLRMHTILDSIDNFLRKEQENLIKKNNDFPPNIQKLLSLVYQNQWWPALTDPELEKIDDGKPPNIRLQLFSCFKHMNGKKLSSHLWFFQGFCRYLQPQFVVLLDVGTKPATYKENGYNGLANLIKGFYTDKDLGGVTGLMSIDSQFPSLEGDAEQEKKSGFIENCCFSIQKAQEYQYIMAHFLDKNFESLTGFLHVLPGAWSAYRYNALIKSDKYEENLLQRSYFKPILNPEMEQNSGYDEQNMYLAEDRILSLGIYCQRKASYILGYVPDAVAYTDPMKDHKNLMAQRRRWINSSLFAFLYVWKNYYFNVLESDHNPIQSYIAINFSMIFAGLSFINSYFTPSLYFFVLYITIAQLGEPVELFQGIATIVSLFYCLVIVAAIGGSLLGKEWEKQAHIVSNILTVFTFAMFALVLYNIFAIYLNISNIDWSSFKEVTVVVVLVINIVSFLFVVLMHIFTHFTFVARLFGDTISYMAYQGAYSQTMVIYGMCNVDDVSWGTKGATGSGGESKFYDSKVFFVSTWLFYNCLLAYILIYVDLVVPQRQNKKGGMVLIGIVIYSTFIIGTKSLMAILNFLHWIIKSKICKSKVEVPDQNIHTVKKKWKELEKKYVGTYV